MQPEVFHEPEGAHVLRARLVGELIGAGALEVPAVIEAIRNVPRHLFASGHTLEDAYADRALPLGRGQAISPASVVARMTEALELKGHERVLEIGTGSGYQAAVLSLLAREVFSIERLAALAVSARHRLARLGYVGVHVICGDGHGGWPAEAPFDRIVVTASASVLPQRLLEQLADGGLMVVPLGAAPAARGEPRAVGPRLVRVTKRGRRVDTEDLGDAALPPMGGGVGP